VRRKALGKTWGVSAKTSRKPNPQMRDEIGRSDTSVHYEVIDSFGEFEASSTRLPK